MVIHFEYDAVILFTRKATSREAVVGEVITNIQDWLMGDMFGPNAFQGTRDGSRAAKVVREYVGRTVASVGEQLQSTDTAHCTVPGVGELRFRWNPAVEKNESCSWVEVAVFDPQGSPHNVFLQSLAQHATHALPKVRQVTLLHDLRYFFSSPPARTIQSLDGKMDQTPWIDLAPTARALSALLVEPINAAIFTQEVLTAWMEGKPWVLNQIIGGVQIEVALLANVWFPPELDSAVITTQGSRVRLLVPLDSDNAGIESTSLRVTFTPQSSYNHTRGWGRFDYARAYDAEIATRYSAYRPTAIQAIAQTLGGLLCLYESTKHE